VSGPPEFKARAIDLCRSSEGLTIADVARELGIGTKTSRKGVLSRHTKSRVGDPGSRRSAGLGRMTTMAVIGITGSTDGIGRAAARVLLADGHRVSGRARVVARSDAAGRRDLGG
jgi:hypothetical protein